MSKGWSDGAGGDSSGPTRRERVTPGLAVHDATTASRPRSSTPPSTWRRRPRLVVGSRAAGGRFEVQSELGEGGMGVVYEAFDAERAEMVALKTITRPDPADVFGLKREFRALADLTHENLVRLHELFVDDEQCFFTMELVAGEAFHRHVRPQGVLDVRALRAALPQLLSAVGAIHRVGKLHRDLKPSNVLVDPDGRVVVLDFGLVSELGSEALASQMHDGQVVGTPGYMAPEQVDRKVGTPATDLYAVGVMLFEALCGELPFQGRPVDAMRAKRRKSAPRIRLLAPNAPDDLADLCDALLERDPARRPSLEEIHRRLLLAPPESPGLQRMGAPRSIAPMPLLGRDAELAQLKDAHRAAREGGRPVVVLVEGESGIGKSALVEQALMDLGNDGALVLRGRCYEREAVPYKAFDAVVDELSRHLHASADRELWTLRPDQLSALRRLFPVLGRIRMVAGAPHDETDVRELRRRGFDALGELLTRIAERRPLVVFIDDLQWSDRDSTTLLLHLLRQAEPPRMLLIGTHRTRDAASSVALDPLYAALGADGRMELRPLALGPLGAEAAEALARQLEVPAVQVLARESGGNPFLLGELARWSARRGQRAEESPTGPVSLHAAMGERVDGLDAGEARLLEVLAVAARPLPLAIAAEAADVESTAHNAMDSLRAHCLGHSAGPSGSVECYHDRIREAVVARLAPDELRGRHLALATALSSQRGADPEHLYTHYAQAGEAGLAAEYAREAAARAIRGLAFERAISFCDRALSLGSFGREQTRQLRETRAAALASAGRGPEAARAYLSAAEEAEPGQDTLLQRRAAEQLLMSGDLGGGHGLLADALSQLGIELPRSRARCMVSLMLLRGRLRLRGLQARPRQAVGKRDARRLEALLASGSALSRTDPVAAAEAGARHLLLALKVGGTTDVARALAWELLFATMFELPNRRTLDIVERARAAAEAADDWEAWASFHRHHGFFLRSKHEPEMERAHEELEASLTVHREHPLPTTYYDRPWGEWNRDLVRVYLGRFDEVARALPLHLDEAERRSDMCIFPVWASMVLPRLAIGDADAAAADYARAERLWTDRNFTLQSLCMLEGSTLLANHGGEPARAADVLERAFATVSRSPLYRGQSIVGLVGGLRARNAARRAELAGTAFERRELTQVVIESASVMARSRSAWADHTDAPVLAAAAHLQGDDEGAVRHLRAGAERLAGVPLLAHACRRQLGVLLGGDTGRELIADSDAFFERGGAHDGARVAALVNPGFGG